MAKDILEQLKKLSKGPSDFMDYACVVKLPCIKVNTSQRCKSPIARQRQNHEPTSLEGHVLVYRSFLKPPVFGLCDISKRKVSKFITMPCIESDSFGPWMGLSP